MPTIYIECTSAYETDSNTGIQRVVRNAVRYAGAIAERYGYSVLPVTLDGGLIVVSLETVINQKRSKKRELSPTGQGGYRDISQPITSLLRVTKYIVQEFLDFIVVVLPFDPVRRFAFGPTFRRRLYRWLRGPSYVGDAYAKAVVVGRGDILLLLDASWVALDSWSAVRRFKADGGQVAAVIYDLIPLDYPQDCLPEHVAVFKLWLMSVVSVTNAFVCISRSVAQRLSLYLEIHSPANKVPVAYFHLGSELDPVHNDDVRPAFSGVFSVPRHVFIVVGSIEPRKNHAWILDAFDRLWRAGEEATIVIIGREGWLSGDVLGRIETHPEFGHQLFFVRDASDAELDYAYRNASALVTASRIEGFGLPVVEAFQHGLPVLCSDIPAFREIADGKAEFFTLDDPNHLADLLRKFVRTNTASSVKARVPQKCLTWRESTEELFAVLMKSLAPPARLEQP